MNIKCILWFFGFISGFLLLITGNSLNFWLTKDGCDLKLISLFSLVSLPYAVNFIWAPFLDRIKLDCFKFCLHSKKQSDARILSTDFRFRWLFLLHFFGVILTFLLSIFDASRDSMIFALIAFCLAFMNTTQDLVLSALRSIIASRENQKDTSGIYIFGYRSGMLISGPLAIFASDYISWNAIYKYFALIYAAFPIILYYISKYEFAPELDAQSEYAKDSKSESSNLNLFGTYNSFSKIKSALGGCKSLICLLSFLCLYRLSDNFIAVMLNPFLIELGFGAAEISIAGKVCGLIGAAFGGIIASKIIDSYLLTDCLLYFGIIHGVSHTSYILLAYYGLSIKILIFASLFESITGGMTMAAYITLITKLSSGKYRATQYAIFSAMMGASRTILPSFAGFIAPSVTWIGFFIICSIMIIPSLLLIKHIKPILMKKNIC